MLTTAHRSAFTWRTAARRSACGPAATGRSSRTRRATITTRRSAKPAGRRRNFSRRANCSPNIFCPAKPCRNRRRKIPSSRFAPVELKETAPLFDNLPAAVNDETPRNMEAYDQGYGCILYRTKIPAGPATTLEAAAIHDFGFVFLMANASAFLTGAVRTRENLLPERKADSAARHPGRADGPHQFRAGDGRPQRPHRAGETRRRNFDRLGDFQPSAG